MSRRIVSISALLMIVGFGGSLFGQEPFRGGMPSDAMLGRLGLQRAWWAQASIDPLRDRVKYFTSDEQETYLQTALGMVTAFDNATGRRRWSVQVGSVTEIRFPAVTNEQLVVIVSGTAIYALDKRSGDVAWQVQVPLAASTAPGLDDRRVYVGTVNGSVYAYDLKFLDQLSKNPRLSADMYRSLAWQYKTGARILFPPVSTGKVVTVASADSSLYGLSAEDRKLHFQFESDRPLSTPITQFGNLIFIATEDRKVYCLNADTGAIKWELLAGLELRQAPRVVGDHVFLRPQGYGMRCLSLATSRELWINRRAVGFLAATPAVVYASDSLGNVLLLNPNDGRQIGAFSMIQFPIRIANERTDRLYFASERGLVVCIRERERDFPLFHKSPEKGPILPEVAPDEQGNKASAAKKPSASEKKKPDSDEAGAEEKKEGGDASPAADENSEKPATSKAPPSKTVKPPAKPAQPDSQ
jgi:outer membrane protein assembly factor BamB